MVYMATTENSGGGAAWDSAKEFAVDRLKEETESLSPSALAEEYGCSGDHMRHCLGDLVEDQIAERVGHGQYTAGEPAVEHEERTDSQGEDSSENTEDMGDIGPSVDGPAPSEDPDTTDQNPVVDEEERADVDLSGSENDDSDDLDEDRAADGSGVPTGWVIIAGFALLAAVVLVSSMSQSGESEDDGDGEQEESTQATAQWGAN